MNKESLFDSLYNLYELSFYAGTLEKEKRILKNIDNIADEFNLKKEFLYHLDSRLFEEGVTPYTPNVTFIEFAEGSKHIEVWVSTSLLDNTIGSAYLIDIDKDVLLREDRVEKQDEPFIYADPNEPILACELELIEEILSYINRDLFVQVKTSFPHPATILGVDVEFRYTEEYIENMRRGQYV